MTLEKQKNSIKNTENGFVRGALSLTVAVIIVKIISYIYKVPLSHVLGDGGMGYFNSAYTVFTFFYMLCSGGIPRAVSIVIAEMNATSMPSERKRALGYIMSFFAVVGLCAALVLLFSAGLISKAIGNSGATLSMLCIAPSLLFVALSGVARGYLTGVSNMIPVAFSQVIEGVVKFVFGMLLALLGVRLGFDLPAISAMTISGVTLGALASSIYLLLYTKTKKTSENSEQNFQKIGAKNIIKRTVKLAAPITLSSAIMGMAGLIDLGFVMQRLADVGYTELEAGALYGNFTTLVVPMLNLVMALVTPLTTAALPMFATCYSLKDTESLNKKAEDLIGLCLFLTIPSAIGISLFSEEVLSMLFKPESAKIAAPLLVLLAPSFVFLPLLTMINTILEATSHTKAPLISMSVGAVVKGIVSYVLVGTDNFGIAGAPIGTSISYGISFLISFILMMYLSGVGLSVFKGFIGPALIGGASVGCAKLLYNALIFRINSSLLLIICITLAVLMYFVISSIFAKLKKKRYNLRSKSTKMT